MHLDPILVSCLLGTLGVALVHDLHEHRIPNVLILAGGASALVLQAVLTGLHGLGGALLGAAVGFGLMLPLYLLRGMAAGDVKLMAVVGAFTGPAFALEAVMWTLLVGGLLGAAMIASRIYRDARPEADGGLFLRLAVARETNAGTRLVYPYAVAIAGGTLVALLRG